MASSTSSTPPQARPGFAVPREIGEEFAQLLRALAVFRGGGLGSRALWPMVVVWLLWPTSVRALPLLLTFGVLVVLGSVRFGATVTDGKETSFILFNGVYGSILHASLLALTGGVASPLAPMMVVWSFVTSLLLGEGVALRRLRAWSVMMIGLQTSVTFSGLAGYWAPPWLPPPTEPRAVAFAGAVLVAFVFLSSRVATGFRAVYLRGVWRVREAHGVVLDSYAVHAEERVRFSAALAHELKNPLASIKGLAALLGHPSTDEKRAERLGVLRRETERLQTTLETMLVPGYASVGAPLVSAALRVPVEEVAELFEGRCADAGVAIVIDGDAQAMVDVDALRQILLNVVGNALEASPPGGTIRIAIRAQPPTIVVDDDGAGLQGDAVLRAFEAGVTTKEGGHGLGLAIARGLASRQGGRLTLTSRDGGGARATLAFTEAS